jgi:hypothetical protein
MISQAIMGYAQTRPSRSDKEMSALQPADEKKAVWQDTGGHGGIQTTQILQPALHVSGLPVSESDPTRKWKTRTEIPERQMRAVRDYVTAFNSSSRQKLEQQRSLEFGYAVHVVSYFIASQTGRHPHQEIETALSRLSQAFCQTFSVQYASDSPETNWASIVYQDRRWIVNAACLGVFHAEWPSVGRVATGIPNRVPRLRALGNSVVPQLVCEILLAIKKCSEH